MMFYVMYESCKRAYLENSHLEEKLFSISLILCLHEVMKVKVLVTQLCLTLCDPMDCSPPGSSVHGIFQARNTGVVVISFSRRSS